MQEETPPAKIRRIIMPIPGTQHSETTTDPTVRYDGIRYRVGSWKEVGDSDENMVEATMWSNHSRFPRIAVIERTW
jgi:hypothetical protein